MAKTNIEKVRALFEAIRAQDVDRAVQYVGPRFVQHDPSMATGVEGFRQYIVDPSLEQLDLTVVWAFEDGPYVVTQGKAEATGENLFAVYRFEDGLIAEQWTFYAPDAPPNKSGYTQLDGPSEAKHLEDTEKNKAFARRYYETFHLAGDRSQNHDFFTGDLMIRHEPGVQDGLGEFLRDVEGLMQHRTIDEIKLLLCQGDCRVVCGEQRFRRWRRSLGVVGQADRPSWPEAVKVKPGARRVSVRPAFTESSTCRCATPPCRADP